MSFEARCDETCESWPTALISLRTASCDMKTQNVLEGCVIKWCYLIDGIITDNPEKLFENGSHPTPCTEYTFWRKRFSNLDNIYHQLTDNKRKVIGLVLEATNSVYFAAFKQLFQKTVASLAQAKDIQIHLNAFSHRTQAFEAMDFIESRPLITPLIHCACVMWSLSPYYSSHWATFFRMMGNMVVEQATKSLNPDALFQGDVEDGLIKVAETIEIIEIYK